MPFKVECELDLTDGFELESLVGRIRLSDGKRSLQEDAVYLDSWLQALGKAAMEMEGGSKETVIDMVEEPQPLVVSRDQFGSVHISFKGREVAVQTPADFRRVVEGATELFVSQVQRLSGGEYQLPPIS